MIPAEVRVATPADAEAVLDLHHACWREAYTGLIPDADIERRFADRDAYVERRRARLARDDVADHVAVRDGEFVGFSSAGPPRDDDPPAGLELYALYARARCWGQGVGYSLLRTAVGDRAAYLWVLECNERGRAFYLRQGFVADGVEEEHPEGRHLRMVSPGRAPSRR